jgi:PRTRC genetic system protein C
MAFQVRTTNRSFILVRKDEDDNITLADPNPNMDPCQVMKFYSSEYPELTSSTIQGPVMREDTAIYNFETIIGDKG